MACEDFDKSVWLQMSVLKKGALGTDESGNWVFDVEASNENLDMQGQKVLRDALLASKDYFLTNGVVSKDHRHEKVGDDGKIDFDENFVIGEPKKVYVGDDGNVRVQGCLYRNNPYARAFAKLLEAGSTRVKASVGGLRPVVEKMTDGTREIGAVTKVLWNDLALTLAPVNPTVSPARLVKSMTGAEFVKSIAGGFATDAAAMGNGRALQKEDCGKKAPLVGLGGGGIDKAGFLLAVCRECGKGSGEVDKNKIRDIACDFNVDWATAQEILNREKLLEGGLAMAKGWDELEKAVEEITAQNNVGGGETPPNDENEETVDLDNLPPEENQSGGETDERLDEMSKRIDEIAGKVDSLKESIGKSCGEMDNMAKSLAKAVEAFAATPQMRKSIVNAGGIGAEAQKRRHAQFTRADADEARVILMKAFRDGEISSLEATIAEKQINKSIADANFQIDEKFCSILRGGAKKDGGEK